jgi:hypothetical protein
MQRQVVLEARWDVATSQISKLSLYSSSAHKCIPTHVVFVAVKLTCLLNSLADMGELPAARQGDRSAR